MRRSNRYKQPAKTPDDALKLALQAKQAAEAAIEALTTASEKNDKVVLSPKELATARKEPWVDTVSMHVNPDNIRNGFFELDWNDYFIEELIKAGYGFEADPQEQIVDRWFRDIVRDMLIEEGLDPNREIGLVNVSKIK